MKRVALILVCVLIPSLAFAGSLDNAKKALQEEKQESYEKAIKKQLVEIEKAKERLRQKEEALEDMLDKGLDKWWIEQKVSRADDITSDDLTCGTITSDYVLKFNDSTATWYAN